MESPLPRYSTDIPVSPGRWAGNRTEEASYARCRARCKAIPPVLG